MIETSPVIEIGKMKLREPYMIIKPGITEEEYFEMTDEDSNCELFEGEIIMNTPASTRHEKVFMFLSSIMKMYVDVKKLGEIIGSRLQMKLENGTLPEPEIIFITRHKLHLLKEQYLDGPADLVVEILSPSTYSFDLSRKRDKYRKNRIKEIWFIDIINNRLLIDYLEKGRYKTVERKRGKVESKIMKGFRINAEWLFQTELPNSYEILNKILE